MRRAGGDLVERARLDGAIKTVRLVAHQLNGKLALVVGSAELLPPLDSPARELVDGEQATVRSRAGEVTAVVEVTDAVMPGVVSLPHGWGHDAPGASMRVAADHAGTNSNVLADELLFDAISGNAVLNGIPVHVEVG